MAKPSLTISTPQASATNPLPAFDQNKNVDAASKASLKHLKSYTPGSFLFDASVYGGLNYVVNGAISVGLAYYAWHRPSSLLGKGYLGTVEGLKGFLGKFSKNSEWVAKKAADISDYTWLGTGGFAVLLPIKWLEDSKPSLVRYADEKVGTAPKDAEGKAAYEQSLEAAPKQSYLSLLGGRCVSLAGTLLATSALSDVFSPYVQKMEVKMRPGFAKFTKSAKAIDSLPHITSKEVVSCLVGTVLLYGSSKAIAYVNHYYKDGRDAAKVQAKEEIPKAQLTDAARQMSGRVVEMPEMRSVMA